jgi:hypothetical protein
VVVDASSVVLPGAQSLVSAILADGWAATREVLARRWSARGAVGRKAAERRLDAGHEQSLIFAGEGEGGGEGEGEGEGRAARLTEYWAGYLAGQAADRTDLLDAVRELAASRASAARDTRVHNVNTGSVGTLLQLGDVHGGISIGNR